MGNYKEGLVSLQFKEIPPFIHIILVKEKNTNTYSIDDYSKFYGYEISVSSDKYNFVYTNEWIVSGDIITDTTKASSDSLDFKVCNKDLECQEELLQFVDDCKPYLIDNHPNIIGECHDEDGYDEYNFIVYLDLQDFLNDSKIQKLTVCRDCDKYSDFYLCKHYSLCKERYDYWKDKI